MAYNSGYNAGTAAEHSYNSSKAFTLSSGIDGAWAIYPLPYPTTNIIQITAEYTEGTCVSGDYLRLMGINGGDLSENYGLTLFLSQNQVQGDNVAYIAVKLTSRSEAATVILRVKIIT